MKKNSFLNMRGTKKHLIGVFMLCMFFFLGAVQVEAQSLKQTDPVGFLEIEVVSLTTLIANTTDPVRLTYRTELLAYFNAIIDDVQNNGMEFSAAKIANKDLRPIRGNAGGAGNPTYPPNTLHPN